MPLLLLLLLCWPAEALAETSPLDRSRARERYQAGEASMRNEDFEEAVRQFRSAALLDPDFVLAHYSLGQAQMALKRYPEAVAAYVACREAVLRLGSLDAREWQEADSRRRDEIRELQDSLQRLRSGKIKGASPGADVAIEQRIRLLEEAGLRGVEHRPRVPAELSLALGSAYFRQQRLAEARREYEAAVRENPRLGAAHNNLAVVHLMSGRPREAAQALRRAEEAGFPVHPRLRDDVRRRLEAEKD